MGTQGIPEYLRGAQGQSPGIPPVSPMALFEWRHSEGAFVAPLTGANGMAPLQWHDYELSISKLRGTLFWGGQQAPGRPWGEARERAEL